jgi:hypothetical protein
MIRVNTAWVSAVYDDGKLLIVKTPFKRGVRGVRAKEPINFALSGGSLEACG